MSIPSKITLDFYIQSIDLFCKPLVERAQITDRPCEWIVDVEKEHAEIASQMKNGIEAAKTVGDQLLKKLQPRMASIASIGLGVGLGGFCAVIAGGGVLSIALGIIGALAGLLAGIFIGLWAAKAELARKMLSEHQTIFKLEADWVQGKMEKLDQQIALNGPDQGQLLVLKTHAAPSGSTVFGLFPLPAARGASPLQSKLGNMSPKECLSPSPKAQKIALPISPSK